MTEQEMETERDASLQSAATETDRRHGLGSCTICGKAIKKGVYVDISVIALYFDGRFSHTDEMYRATLQSRICHLHCAEKILKMHVDVSNLNAYEVIG